MRSSVLIPFVLAVVLPLSVVAAEIPDTPKESFSIVVIPDTQHYRGKGTKVFKHGQYLTYNHSGEDGVMSDLLFTLLNRMDVADNSFLRF